MSQSYNQSLFQHNINNGIRQGANMISNTDRKYPVSVNAQPLNNLTLPELDTLLGVIQKIKSDKLQQDQNRANQFCDPTPRDVPVDWRNLRGNGSVHPEGSNIVPGSRGSIATRNIKKNENNDYHNPYEYGAKQNQIGQLNKPLGKINYESDPSILSRMGLSQPNLYAKFPGHIRNVDVESSLLQQEATHLPGQREVTQTNYDRFQYLPYDPQDPNHIVWSDMPRGGHPTRVERLEF